MKTESWLLLEAVRNRKRGTYVVQFNFVLIVLFVMTRQLIKDGAASSSAVISWWRLRIETAVCIWNNNCTIAVHYTFPPSYSVQTVRRCMQLGCSGKQHVHYIFNDLHVSKQRRIGYLLFSLLTSTFILFFFFSVAGKNSVRRKNTFRFERGMYMYVCIRSLTRSVL